MSPQGQSSDRSSPFPWSYFWVSVCIFLISGVPFAIATVRYCSDQFIDRKLNILETGEASWLIILFLLPLLVQAASIWVFLTPKKRSDKSVRHFYRLCLFSAAICSSGYCTLWLLYTLGLHNRHNLSYCALVLACVSTGTVGFVT